MYGAVVLQGPPSSFHYAICLSVLLNIIYPCRILLRATGLRQSHSGHGFLTHNDGDEEYTKSMPVSFKTMRSMQNGSKTKEQIMQVVKCNKRHVRITAPPSSTSRFFRLPVQLRNHESALPVHDDFVNLRLDLVQVAFQ